MIDRPIRVHIGHHFYGTGNIGDDLMMAGFMQSIARLGAQWEMTCCILGDVDSQRRRFPQVTWLPVDQATVAGCIARCDAWLGLGDTPFQSEGAAWFIDFLVMQAQQCALHRKPMFFLGVGVHDAAVMQNPAVARLMRQADASWTRDSMSHELLSPLAPGRVHHGADLANLYLATYRHSNAAIGEERLGLTLNFEGPARYDATTMTRIVSGWAPRSVYWLVQEVRALPGSEVEAYGGFPDELRASLALAQPDYRSATVDTLFAAWPPVTHVITSRYHSALFHAWRGARIALVDREVKLQSAARDLDVAIFPDVDSAFQGLSAARPVADSRTASLQRLAMDSVQALVDRISAQ